MAREVSVCRASPEEYRRPIQNRLEGFGQRCRVRADHVRTTRHRDDAFGVWVERLPGSFGAVRDSVVTLSGSVDSTADHVDSTADHVDSTADHVDSMRDHVDSTADHVDSMRDHVDSTADHVDSTADHVDSTADHVDSMRDHVRGGTIASSWAHVASSCLSDLVREL